MNKKMYDDDKLSYTIIKRILVYALIIVGIILVGFKEPKPLVLGFIFGTSIGILGFRLLELTIKKSLTMTPRRASMYSMGQYLIRYFIYAIVLVIAVLADYINFLTTVLGLSMIKIVIITYTVYDSIVNIFNKK